MNPDSASPKLEALDDLLSQGVAAARSGDSQQARRLLMQVLEKEERNVQAWLWLSSVLESFEDVEICLENVLTIEPGNALVRERLNWLERQSESILPPFTESDLGPAPFGQKQVKPALEESLTGPIDADWPLQTCPPAELSLPQLEELVISDPGNFSARREWLVRTAKPTGTRFPPGDNSPEAMKAVRYFACPQCGGHMHFNPDLLDLQCSYCGHIEEIKEDAAQPEEKVLDRILIQPQGHVSASAERMLRCKQCGAVTIFPPAHVSVVCPYCDSAVFATTAEDVRLEPPQALIPMQIEIGVVREKIRSWLRNSFFAPADLKRAIQQRLSPLYIPIWLISGAISFSDPNGPSLLGARDFLYMDWAVPGIQHPSARHIPDLQPFGWNELVEFKPEYLARWPASTYEVSIASASQRACAGMREDAQRQLAGIEREPGSFFCRSYKLVLFPVWMCNYTYRGRLYHLVVNGQTGKVAGDKPFDWARVILVASLASVSLGFFGVWLMRLLNLVRQDIATQIMPILDFIGPTGFLLYPAIAALLVLVILIWRG
ncbi:MAG: hypothetical protein AB1649_18530 [Chloroflexota bacterium]